MEPVQMWGEDTGLGGKMRQNATVDEKCPKCGNPQLEFYTMQLRSVDEGQTCFYECVKCRCVCVTALGFWRAGGEKSRPKANAVI